MSLALYEAFARKPMSISDCGLLSACDSRYFGGFQLLFFSVRLGLDVPFTVVDLGMTTRQLEWCYRNNISVIVGTKEDYLNISPYPKTLRFAADYIIFQPNKIETVSVDGNLMYSNYKDALTFVKNLRGNKPIVHLKGLKKYIWGKFFWEHYGEVPFDATIDECLAHEKEINLELFILGHDERVDLVKERSYITKINLNELSIGEFQNNCLAESRFFLSDIKSDKEYIGCATARWDVKYPEHIQLGQMESIKDRLKENIVLVADQINLNWLEITKTNYPGVVAMLKEIPANLKIPIRNRPTFYANNFICHRKVFFEFLAWWKEAFMYFHNKYGFELPFTLGREWDQRRKDAYFYEWLTMLYFANRNDLDITKI